MNVLNNYEGVERSFLIDLSSENTITLKLPFYPYTFNERDNWFGRIFFLHLIRYFHAIRSNIVLKGKTMKMNDLPRLSKNESILDNYLNTKFEVNYETTPWKLGIALFFGDLRSKTFLVLSLYILESVIRQGISLVLSALIQAVLTNQDTSYNYAILLTGLSILSTLIRNHSVYQAIELSAKARFTLMNLVYDKLTILNKNYITGEFAGRIIILASADLNALEQYLLLIFQICVAPVSFILGSIVLCLRFQGPIGLAGIGVLVIIQPMEVFLHHMAIKYTKQAKVYQDERLKLQNEMIQGAKTLKMYAWEEVLVRKITELRRKEVKYHLRSYLLQVLDRTFAFSSQVWGSCAFFAIIYFGNYNQKLTVEDMISTIQLQQFLKQSCVMSISQGLQSFNNIKLIFERLLEIIKAQQFSKQTLDTIKPRNPEESDYLVKLVRYTAYWDNDNDRVPVLHDINMTIKRGDFISLVGRVGSGKSTLLQSIVNQVPYHVGMINHDIKLGYVEQDPYIFQDTIQQNIIFGQPCYQEIYQHVLQATSLDTDLSKMAQGDQTMIGDRGQTLSGGQKTRLSLARALYALPDLYVLDDPFSALDQRVVNEIMKNAIQDYIFEYQVNKQSKTPAVILATHHMSVAKHSAIKITLQDGQIIDHKQQDKSDEDSSGESTPPARQASKKTIIGNEPSRYLMRQGQRIKELDVDYHTSLRYFKYWCNWPLLLLILSMNIATEVIYNLYYRVVAEYSVYESSNQIDNMFVIMSLYTGGVLLNNFIKYFITLNGQFVATNRLHKHMLRSLSNAPLTYVEQNKASAILGKFSSDLSIADHPTLICLFDLFEFSSQFMASLVVLVILEPIFSIFMVITLLLNLAIYRFCRDFIIQTKELDLQAKSGMGDIFRKTVNGLHLIQVYRQQNWFKQEFMKQSNICLLCNFTFHYAQRLFAYYIDLVGLLVQIVGIFTLISLDLTTSQEFAQAMLLLLTFNQNQQWCLRQFLTFGTQMSNFNRIFDLIDVPSEQNRYQAKDKKVIFPNEGAIDFSQVFMRYQQDAEYVLKDLTFKIQPGQSVGFIGRTGTGKSSILQVLYRMVEVEAADRLLIDGIDIRELGLAKVRSSFGLIPQYPFIFTGTIRDNIDPYQNYQDVIILEAIAQVQLLDYIQNLKDGINTVISSSDFLLSFGQKQLICLARVLVQNPKIIIMDEGTANLDEFTDVLIQDAIKRDFKNKTVITIAHRLSTIAGYDRIFVMENGAIIQSGIPLELLISWQKVEAVKCRAIEVLSIGDLSEDSAFASMVLNTGVEKATQIIQLALEAYLKMQ